MKRFEIGFVAWYRWNAQVRCCVCRDLIRTAHLYQSPTKRSLAACSPECREVEIARTTLETS